MRLADLLPHPHEVGLLLREDHRPFLVLKMLQVDLDLVPLLETLGVLELIDRHGAFGLEADVENDGGVGHAEHLRLDDLTFLDVGERPLVQLRHPGELFRGILFLDTGHPAELRVGGLLGGALGCGILEVLRFYQHSKHRFGGEFGDERARTAVLSRVCEGGNYPGKRSRASARIRATWVSNDRPVVSSWTASAAGRSGATGRLASATSRAASASLSRRSAAASGACPPPPSPPRWLMRRRARSSG